MGRIAESTFFVHEWTERPIDQEGMGPTPHMATAWMTYRGDLIGESEASFVFVPSAKGAQGDDAGYVASEHLIVRLHGRSGGFTIQHGGIRERGRMRCTFARIVAGSATRELSGLKGTISIRRSPDGLHTLEIDYRIEPTFPWEIPTPEAGDDNRAADALSSSHRMSASVRQSTSLRQQAAHR